MFFLGFTLFKSITHTNLALFSKIDKVVYFYDLRRITLSNFLNLIISWILFDRLEGVLPKTILLSQTNFLNGRSIIENVLWHKRLLHALVRDDCYKCHY